MKPILFTILFIFLFSSASSFAEVYKWVDDKGVVHFTDDVTQVPQNYRPKAEKMGLSEEIKEEIKVEPGPSPKKEDAYKDRLGKGEDYWKSRIEEWKVKLRDAQAKLETLRLKYNELTEKFNDSKSTAERGTVRKERDQVKSEMDQSRVQIEEAKEMLEKKIPDEADLYKAKPEWVKQ